MNKAGEIGRAISLLPLKVGMNMIQLHNISGTSFYLNCDLIYRMEVNYDTIITLTNMQKLIVQETPDEVVQKVIEYRRQIHTHWREDKE